MRLSPSPRNAHLCNKYYNNVRWQNCNRHCAILDVITRQHKQSQQTIPRSPTAMRNDVKVFACNRLMVSRYLARARISPLIRGCESRLVTDQIDCSPRESQSAARADIPLADSNITESNVQDDRPPLLHDLHRKPGPTANVTIQRVGWSISNLDETTSSSFFSALHRWRCYTWRTFSELVSQLWPALTAVGVLRLGTNWVPMLSSKFR